MLVESFMNSVDSWVTGEFFLNLMEDGDREELGLPEVERGILLYNQVTRLGLGASYSPARSSHYHCIQLCHVAAL